MQQRFSTILIALAITGCARHSMPPGDGPALAFIHVAAIPPFSAESATRDSTSAVTYALVGTVVDADSGQPLGASEILVRRASDGKIMETLTDAQGGFVIPQIPAGRYGLIVRRIGYVSVSDLRDAQAGAVDTLRLKMWPAQNRLLSTPGRSSLP